MKKLAITAVVLSVLAASYFLFFQPPQNDIEGTISIVVVDQIGDTVSQKEIDFTEDDTLFDILDEEFTLGCANASYQLSDTCEPLLLGSRVILQIDDVVTDWTNNYIGIYIDDEYSNYGVDSIPLQDGSVYRFEFLEVGEE